MAQRSARAAAAGRRNCCATAQTCASSTCAAMWTRASARRLTRTAPPDVAVITNVHPVHLAFFKSLEDIASAKAEILEGLKPGGTAVLNADDPLVQKAASVWKGRRISFGFREDADVRAEQISLREGRGLEFHLVCRGDKAKVFLPFFSEAFVENALAAVGVALALGLTLNDIVPLFPRLRPSSQRSDVLDLPNHIVLIDDSYNSNPRALESALRGAARVPAARRVAVLGDMLELGPSETDFHLEAGRLVAELGFGLLVTVGPLARHIGRGAAEAGLAGERIFSFSDSAAAAAAIPSLLRRGDLVLVKGSRGVRLEIVVNGLKQTKER